MKCTGINNKKEKLKNGLQKVQADVAIISENRKVKEITEL
jgi:hypothetical protein